MTPWICAKCGTTVGGDRTICRACGAAAPSAADSRGADEVPSVVAGPPTDVAAVRDESGTSEPGATIPAPWICPKCRTMVEGDFEVCWQCGTSNVGVENPDFRRIEDAASASPYDAPMPGDERERRTVAGPRGEPPDRTCPACGETLVPIQLIDASGRHGMVHQELGYAASGAQTGGWFGDPLAGVIRAQLCPRCGRVGFYAVPTT